jgi:hypothetical protein
MWSEENQAVSSELAIDWLTACPSNSSSSPQAPSENAEGLVGLSIFHSSGGVASG